MSTKVLVAIHGIGDQTAYATIQSVAAQLGNYYDIGAPIPLGRFYPDGAQADGPVPTLMVAPPDPAAFAGFGFAEVYWTSVPRGVAEAGYVLEETKRWARTVVGRMVLRAAVLGKPMPDREQLRLITVLDELPVTGAIAALVLIGQFLVDEQRSDMEIWPTAIGAIAFFYIWWVATLLFDLVFVWHRFVRHSTTTFAIAEICQQGYVKTNVEVVVEKCGKVMQDRRVRRAKQA